MRFERLGVKCSHNKEMRSDTEWNGLFRIKEKKREEGVEKKRHRTEGDKLRNSQEGQSFGSAFKATGPLLCPQRETLKLGFNHPGDDIIIRVCQGAPCGAKANIR